MEDNKVFLYTKTNTKEDCEKLKTEVLSIINFHEKSSKDNAGPSPVIDCKKNPPIQKFEITPFLPKVTLSLLKEDNFCTGPNCMNAALLAAGAMSSIRQVDAWEFHHFIKSNCTKRASTELAKSGDVGLITLERDPSFHAFYHISDSVVFTKNGFFSAQAQRFKFQTKEDMMRECLTENPEVKKLGKPEVSYFHCPESVIRSSSKLHNIERFLSDCTTGKIVPSMMDLDLMRLVIQALKKESETDAPALNSIEIQLRFISAVSENGVHDLLQPWLDKVGYNPREIKKRIEKYVQGDKKEFETIQESVRKNPAMLHDEPFILSGLAYYQEWDAVAKLAESDPSSLSDAIFSQAMDMEFYDEDMTARIKKLVLMRLDGLVKNLKEKDGCQKLVTTQMGRKCSPLHWIVQLDLNPIYDRLVEHCGEQEGFKKAMLQKCSMNIRDSKIRKIEISPEDLKKIK